MKILEWNGEIGWALWPEDLKLQLDNTNGEDITIRFSSEGGNILKGSDIFNMLVDYKRDNPTVKMNLEIKAIAASMASAIASAPVWDNITIEPTSIVMIHNPSLVANGDFRKMTEVSKFLESMKGLWMGVYARRSGKKEPEVSAMMDEETWLFGQEIIDAGFADSINAEVIETGEMKTKPVVMAFMKSKITDMEKRQSELTEIFDYTKAVACLRLEDDKQPPEMNIDTPEKSDEIKPAPVGNLKTEVPMITKEELKKDNPELYASMMKDGADSEREKNNERVKALTAMKQDEDYKDLPEVLEVIDKAIMGTDTADSVLPKINIAVMKIMKDPARMAAIESPDDITGGGDPKPKSKIKKSAEV